MMVKKKKHRFFLPFITLPPLLLFSFLFKSVQGQIHYHKIPWGPQSFDSVVIHTIRDLRFEMQEPPVDSIVITGRAVPFLKDMLVFHKKIAEKSSFTASQASTPNPDVEFLYMLDGKMIERIRICLYTNNLLSTIPIEAQKQGDCSGSDEDIPCFDGGISRKFKKYLLNLLVKYKLPVDKKEILDFGKS